MLLIVRDWMHERWALHKVANPLCGCHRQQQQKQLKKPFRAVPFPNAPSDTTLATNWNISCVLYASRLPLPLHVRQFHRQFVTMWSGNQIVRSNANIVLDALQKWLGIFSICYSFVQCISSVKEQHRIIHKGQASENLWLANLSCASAA